MRLALLIVVACAGRVAAAPPTGAVKLPCKAVFQRITPDGTHAVIACDGVGLADLTTGKLLGSAPTTLTINSAVSADSSTFAIAPKGKVEVHRIRDYKLVATVDTHTAYTLALALSTDGKLLLVAPLDKPPEVWSVAGTPKKLATLQTELGTAAAAAFSRDGSRLAVSTDDLAVRVYDTTTWKSVADKTDQSASTLALAWSTDGKTLALGIVGGTVMLTDATLHVTQTFAAHGDFVAEVMFVGDKVVARHRKQRGGAELVLWSADGKPTILNDKRNEKRMITGGGVVDGALWLASATGDSLEIWAP